MDSSRAQNLSESNRAELGTAWIKRPEMMLRNNHDRATRYEDRARRAQKPDDGDDATAEAMSAWKQIGTNGEPIGPEQPEDRQRVTWSLQAKSGSGKSARNVMQRVSTEKAVSTCREKVALERDRRIAPRDVQSLELAVGYRHRAPLMSFRLRSHLSYETSRAGASAGERTARGNQRSVERVT
jgi:hypothetical protein